MVSYTIESLPAWNFRKVPFTRYHASRSLSLQTSSFARTKKYTEASFAAYPHDFTSSSSRLTTVCNRIGNNRKPLRSSWSASQGSFWGLQSFLLQTGDKLPGAASRCSEGSDLLELDRLKYNFCGTRSKKGIRSDCQRLKTIRSRREDSEDDNEYCDRSTDEPHGACSFRQSSSPSTREGTRYKEGPDGSDPDQSGYTIKVSRELMGVFRYVEKVKRARIKELADTLKQTAGACMFFSCVRGIVGPLVEVFQTQPPSWGRLILMLSAVDSFAITYLALKAAEPLEKLSVLASESEKDIMGSIEKEEEHMLALAVELVKLFRRLRNITVITAVAQFASLVHTLLQLKNPKLVAAATKIISTWFHIPWV